MKKIENTIPVLPVKNLKRSLDYYVEKLGFKEDWCGVLFGSVSRDDCHIMLREDENSFTPVWVWVGLEDYSLFDEFKGKGVAIYQEAINWDWGYEMKFNDLDGNILWLGTASRDDLPKKK